MGVLCHGASLLCLRNGPLGDRQRAAEVTKEHASGGERSEHTGPQSRGRAIRQQRHGPLGGVDGRVEVAGVEPVTAEPLQQPRPLSRRRVAGLDQGVIDPPSGTVGIPRPACGPRRLLQQGGARLGQPGASSMASA